MKKLNVLSLSLLLSLAMAGCDVSTTNTGSNSSTGSTTNTSSVSGGEQTSQSSDKGTNSSTGSSTSDTKPVVVTVDEGNAETAIANAGKFYYTKDENASVSGVVEDGVSKITISGMTTQNSVVFYYEAPEVTTGERYELSFTINSKAVLSYVTINGTVYELAKGDNTIGFRFTETDDPTLTIVMGEEGNDVVTESNEIAISTPVVTDVVYKELAPVIDGSLDEWRETKNEENSIGIVGSQLNETEDYTGKSATFYASLQEDGLYVAAEVYHSVYTTEAALWWQCSNLEFFLGDANAQGWISADGSTQLATTKSWNTTEVENGYYTIVEGIIPTENLPEGSVVAGEIRVGFAWKTIGDKCNNGEANGGGADEYWVPKGTWPNNADKAYVTKNGIFRKSQNNFELADFKTVTLDGDLSDWEGINGVTLTGTGDYSYKDVTWYARTTSEGLFVAAKAHHDVYTNDNEAWHQNTNMEFWLSGDNQKYISANGNAAGGVYGTHTTKELDGDGAIYETVFECVVPNVYLEAYLNDGVVSIGFAWKTPGDTITGGGDPIGASEWWILATHNRHTEQFTVTADGLVDPKA